jgi:hypothetical protein
MKLRNDDPHGIRMMLATRVGHSADPSAIAALAVAIWQELEAALEPMFEERGVAALYRRSLELAAEDHPCLAHAHDPEHHSGKFASLATILAEQEAVQASTILVALLNTFHELLTGVFGGSMFEKLLRSIWERHIDSHQAGR